MQALSNESAIGSAIQRAASSIGWRLFRNNTGAYKLHGRLVRYGLCKGSPDYVGFTDRGQFVAVECKDGTDIMPEQRQFLKMVIQFNGIAIIARSLEDFYANVARTGSYDAIREGTAGRVAKAPPRR